MKFVQFLLGVIITLLQRIVENYLTNEVFYINVFKKFKVTYH